MKIQGAITFLFNADGATLEIKDRASSITFVEVKLTTKQVCQMLSRLAHTDCEEVLVHNLDIIGKKMESKPFEFEIPECDWSEKKQCAIETLKVVCPEGWYADTHFMSRDSFFSKDGKEYARTFIRRWV